MDDNLGYVVVGGQLDLELDGGGVVLRLAQIMLAPSPRLRIEMNFSASSSIPKF
jgi:hypothetical protein